MVTYVLEALSSDIHFLYTKSSYYLFSKVYILTLSEIYSTHLWFWTKKIHTLIPNYSLKIQTHGYNDSVSEGSRIHVILQSWCTASLKQMLLHFFSIRWEHEIKGVFKQANSRKTGSEYSSISCGRHSVNKKILLLPLRLNTKTFCCHLYLHMIWFLYQT